MLDEAGIVMLENRLEKIEEENDFFMKEEIFEMANIRYKEYIIRIWSKGHNPPHFHFIKEGVFDARVSLKDFSYMSSKYGREPTAFEMKDLRKWLNATSKLEDGKTIVNSSKLWVLWSSYHDNE